MAINSDHVLCRSISFCAIKCLGAGRRELKRPESSDDFMRDPFSASLLKGCGGLCDCIVVAFE